MTASLRFALLSLALTAAVFADLTPTAPGPGQTFKAGANCTIQWDVDQSGTWKNVTIDLMSGSNNNMSFVTNVAWGLDGTNSTLTPFNWTCPEVDPYAPIYFYQFTNGATGNATWTTRFTIASPDGEHFPPANATQPSGEPIPWGTGTLASNATDAGSGSDLDSSSDTPTGDSSDDTLDSPSDSDSGSDTGVDGTAPTTDSLDQGSIAHPAQAAPLNLTTMDRHSGDRDGDSSDKDDNDNGTDGEKDSRGDDGNSKDDGDDGDSDDVEDDKNSGKSKSSKGGDGDDDDANSDESSTRSSSEHAKSSPPEKGTTKSSSSDDSDTTSSASHKATGAARAQDDSDTDTAKPSGTGSPSHPASKKTSSPAADPSATANADSAPTAALPPTSKKAHSTASASASGLSGSKTAHAAGSTNTCSCAPDQPGGLSKLLNGGASEVEKVSGWIHLVVPLVIAVLVLY